ncbi:VOC domain-containing protein [Vibrio chagasii]|nr:VOC domain-containing protein [Vibrio chagasii]CAH7059924.1 VOC domain-containing protein [Vibrio chagasii]CAH7467959.1 VOC domain-containing protein [Vibrio chagasii]
MRKLSVLTLGVVSLERSAKFYESVLELERTDYESSEIIFYHLDGAELALFPRDELSKDIGISQQGSGFSGITLAHNVSSSKEVLSLLQKAKLHGGNIVKDGQPVFWGGFSGYFSDPDGHLWEVACGSKEYALEKERA